jgi:hypothetical protein
MQQQYQRDLSKKTKLSGPAGHWVLRRHGYYEQENPEHLVTVVSGTGMPILLAAILKALKP